MHILLSLVVVFMSAISTVLASPELHVNIPEYVLRLVENGQTVKTYSVAVGTPYEQTPIGIFQIFSKEKYPTWFPGNNFTDRTPVSPGPENPLGTRWMEFSSNYGIHGTNKRWDISGPVSGGCIRMQDSDVQELYEKVPIGTPVIIHYQTMILQERSDGLYLTMLPDVYHRRTNTPDELQKLFTPYADRFILLNNFSIPYKMEQDLIYERKIAIHAASLSENF